MSFSAKSCLQIIGSKQDDDEKEVQENELVRDEIIDGDDAEQDQEDKGLFRILNEVVFESFHQLILPKYGPFQSGSVKPLPSTGCAGIGRVVFSRLLRLARS